MISYDGLVKVILNFQLEQHSHMIEPISQKFKEIDTNLDGIINRSQLKSLMLKFYILDDEVVDSITAELDPKAINFITYSQFLKFSFNSKIKINKFDSKGNRVKMSLVDISDMVTKIK